ncbi:uncharacterized protein LOC111602314 [Drosophila hydei]|uniref:Uncharacterized protein LOC111602314 n=1 Tax=Drosophila hydei TaxID=7224 RepID=A0A6J1MDM0_DROHY|nr:uncharacterized protein LOC111602314 [Drosophila hydei]
MVRPQDLGVTIVSVNIVITFYLWGTAIKKITSDNKDSKESTDVRWTGAYGIYLFVNTFLLLCLLKKGLCPIKLWFLLTIFLLVFRVINFDYHNIIDLFINLYIFTSLAVMAYVYSKLKEEQTAEQTPPPVLQRCHNFVSTVNKPTASASKRSTFTAGESPLGVAKPASQMISSKSTINRNEIKPDSPLPPPTAGWSDQRNNGQYLDNWNLKTNIGWQPELRLNLNAPAIGFMPSAPELTSSDSAEDQAKTFNFHSANMMNLNETTK